MKELLLIIIVVVITGIMMYKTGLEIKEVILIIFNAVLLGLMILFLYFILNNSIIFSSSCINC